MKAFICILRGMVHEICALFFWGGGGVGVPQPRLREGASQAYEPHQCTIGAGKEAGGLKGMLGPTR